MKRPTVRHRVRRASINTRALQPFQQDPNDDDDANKLVWVRVPAGASYIFKRGVAVDIREGKAIVQIECEGVQSEVVVSKLIYADEELGTPALTELRHVNPVNICGSIETRYDFAKDGLTGHWFAEYHCPDDIPTSAVSTEGYYVTLGEVLIAVNPFNPCTAPYYGLDWIWFYKEAPIHKHLPPHPFALARKVYNKMMDDRRTHCIVVSGESGSGKTETAKHLLAFLTECSSNGIDSKKDYISKFHPVIESFGNALTVRNRNSSRFGRLLTLHFDDGMGINANIDAFLLAKSRVVLVPHDEQNYHVFYALIQGSSGKTWAKDLHLEGRSESDFALTDHDRVTVPYNLGAIEQSLEMLGVRSSTQILIYRILAVILHLGNIRFKSNIAGEAVLEPTASEAIQIVEELVGAETVTRKLISLLIETVMNIRGSEIRKKISADNASQRRDGVCMHLYNILFLSVIDIINIHTQGHDTKPEGGKMMIFDIFGFEDMNPQGVNGFEQICINYVNEIIQNMFCDEMIKNELELYEREGIDITFTIHSPNFAPMQTLFDHKTDGIFALLNNESQLASNRLRNHQLQSPDTLFAKRVNSKKSDLVLSTAVHSDQCFVISHYSGDIVYDATGFVDRNSDVTMSPEFVAYMQTWMESVDDPLMLYMRRHLAASLKLMGQKSVTNATLFRKQLSRLESILSDSTMWYVRCIKPNSEQLPGKFNNKMVLEQLINGGVVQVLNVLTQGYPCRIPYPFIKKFQENIPDALKRIGDREFVILLAQELGINRRCLAMGRNYLFSVMAGYEKISSFLCQSEIEMDHMKTNMLRRWHRMRLKRAIHGVIFIKRVEMMIRARRKVFADMLTVAYRTAVKRRNAVSIISEYVVQFLRRRRTLHQCAIRIQRAYRLYKSNRVIKTLQLSVTKVVIPILRYKKMHEVIVRFVDRDLLLVGWSTIYRKYIAVKQGVCISRLCEVLVRVECKVVREVIKEMSEYGDQLAYARKEQQRNTVEDKRYIGDRDEQNIEDESLDVEDLLEQKERNIEDEEVGIIDELLLEEVKAKAKEDNYISNIKSPAIFDESSASDYTPKMIYKRRDTIPVHDLYSQGDSMRPVFEYSCPHADDKDSADIAVMIPNSLRLPLANIHRDIVDSNIRVSEGGEQPLPTQRQYEEEETPDVRSPEIEKAEIPHQGCRKYRFSVLQEAQQSPYGNIDETMEESPIYASGNVTKMPKLQNHKFSSYQDGQLLGSRDCGTRYRGSVLQELSAKITPKQHTAIPPFTPISCEPSTVEKKPAISPRKSSVEATDYSSLIRKETNADSGTKENLANTCEIEEKRNRIAATPSSRVRPPTVVRLVSKVANKRLHQL